MSSFECNTNEIKKYTIKPKSMILEEINDLKKQQTETKSILEKLKLEAKILDLSKDLKGF